MKLPELFLPAKVLVMLLVACPASSAPQIAAAAPELLEVEQAFQVSARFLNVNMVELRYQIAEGYYMYRERFKFGTDDAKSALGKAQIPAGKFKQDATFGRVETYRISVRVLLPLVNKGNGSAVIESGKFIALQVTSQGCADAGVCYPPQRHQFRLERGSPTMVRPLSAITSGFSMGGAQAASAQSSPSTGKISDLIKPAP